MRRHVCVVIPIALLIPASGRTADHLKSGPQPGTPLPGAFTAQAVLDVEAPDMSGKKHDFVGEQYRKDPFVLMLAWAYRRAPLTNTPPRNAGSKAKKLEIAGPARFVPSKT